MKYEPLNNKEIEKLLERQLRNDIHPYTCANSHGNLYPTKDVWRCGKCDYFQLYRKMEMRVIGRKL